MAKAPRIALGGFMLHQQGFFAVENLFDKDYDTGRTPLRTIGYPRTIRAGVRIALP